MSRNTTTMSRMMMMAVALMYMLLGYPSIAHRQPSPTKPDDSLSVLRD
jgi:hypothetical protein